MMLAEQLGVVAGILLSLLLVFFTLRSLKRSFWVLFGRSAKRNPFREPCTVRTTPLVTDQKERDRVLKQNFSPDKVPPELDAIVIGSGMGGLTVAAILAKVGKQVLVLEQHDQAGGCCHTFVDKGFEFDVGIHYIGEMAEGTVSRLLVDQLSNCGIQWVKLEEVYDTAILGCGGQKLKSKSFPIPSGRDQLKQKLIEVFPDEEKAIKNYFELLKRMRRAEMVLATLKLFPRWFAMLIVKSGLLRKLAPVMDYYCRSLSEVLDNITDNQDLKAVLAYNFGDYGKGGGAGGFIPTLSNSHGS